MGALLDELRAELRKAAEDPKIYGYRPYKGVQENAHKSKKRGRVLLGGNRVGKTVFGAVESVWYLTGTHPYRETPKPPVYGRGTAVDIEQGLNKIMLPEIQRWLPAKYLINGSWSDSYNTSGRVLTLANGSKMDFLTSEQDVEKHAGTSRNFCWWDEEPPESIFNEDSLRLVDVNGDWWMSMTPLLGFTWIYRRYYRPVVEKGETMANVDVFVGSTENNPHVSKEVMDEITAGMSSEEREARRHGKFVAATGLVYPSFGPHNVIPPINPKGITKPVIVAMDHGLRHPTVWLYCYVDAEGRIIVFHEYYEAERTVAEHCKELDAWEKWAGIKDRIIYTIGDPSIEQRSASTGTSIRTLYSEHDRFIGLANNDVNAGLNRVRAYVEKLGLFITEDCHNLIEEMMGYRWASYANRKTNENKKSQDQPYKVRDDACDALRYLIMSRPDDEFEGWAGEVFIPMTNAAQYAPSEDGDYSYNDLSTAEQDVVHTILGEDW